MTKLHKRSYLAVRAPLLLTLSLAACGHQGIDTAGIAGGASMRVDVEVYKGPLAKQLGLQRQELIAKIDESQAAMQTLQGQTQIAMCRLGCFDGQDGPSHRRYARDNKQAYTAFSVPRPFGEDETWQRHNDSKSFCESFIFDIDIKRPKDEPHDVCHALDNQRFDLGEARARANSLGIYRFVTEFTAGQIPNKRQNCLKIRSGEYVCDNPNYFQIYKTDTTGVTQSDEIDLTKWNTYLSKAALYAEYLRSRAAFWATQQTAAAPESKRARIAIANYAQFLAEYGNQIGSRADGIAKQEALGRGNQSRAELAAELLSSGTYLRDSAPTGYLNLYIHNGAAAGATRAQATDRVRLVEQLTADTHWAKVNSVFAAGQGNVTMAFIKDDIGNWDLKKFDNRPGDLLDAYKDAGLAVLQEVGNLASGGTTSGIKDANRLLSFANRINFGEAAVDTTQAEAQVERLRARTKSRLETLRDSEQQRYAQLDDAITVGDGELSTLRGQLATEASQVSTAESDLAKAQEDLKNAETEAAALTARRAALIETRARVKDEETGNLESDIATLDRNIEARSNLVAASQKLLDVNRATLAQVQATLAATQANIDQKERAQAALRQEQSAVARDAVRLARQILEAYLNSLEEIAGAAATPGATAS